jgi:hypothetical protein
MPGIKVRQLPRALTRGPTQLQLLPSLQSPTPSPPSPTSSPLRITLQVLMRIHESYNLTLRLAQEQMKEKNQRFFVHQPRCVHHALLTQNDLLGLQLPHPPLMTRFST